MIRAVARQIYRALFSRRSPAPPPFPGSPAYWEQRYAQGGNSGAGSYEAFAQFKAEVLNEFVSTHRVQSVIDFGCGDGNQLALASYPAYLGLDVSATAISLCRNRFASDPGKSFRLMGEYAGEKAELALSLDVVYHLVEDMVFERYMHTMFGAAQRHVVVYASDHEDRGGPPHIRHREFTRWVKANLPGWRLTHRLPNRYPYRGDYRTGSFSDFFFFEKQA